MPACIVCGTDLADDVKACHVCGSSIDDVPAPPPATPASEWTLITTGPRRCPDCGTRYDFSHRDSFCTCGSALIADRDSEPDIDLRPSGPVEMGLEPIEPEIAAGVARLVIYSAEREPIHTFVLDRDVTRIGRNDPVRGDFVDLDIGRLFDDETARKVSRKHCLVLRSRETQAFVLRPLAKNTGTQVGNELLGELSDHPLTDGTRIVLGGVVRMKFVSG